jgi:hypothetical protein
MDEGLNLPFVTQNDSFLELQRSEGNSGRSSSSQKAVKPYLDSSLNRNDVLHEPKPKSPRTVRKENYTEFLQ